MMTYVEAILPVVLYRLSYSGAWNLRPAWIRILVTGLWLGMAVWFLGALGRYWVPIGHAWLLGILIMAISMLAQRLSKRDLQPITDLVAVAAVSTLSVIPVDPTRVAIAAALFALVGFGLDTLTRRRLSARGQRWLPAGPVLLTLLLALMVTQSDDFGSRLLAQDRWFPLRLAIAAPLPGKRVHLKSGAAAWWLTDPAGPPRGVAILLHGNNSAASAQPAAIALQGALLRAGYDVLSVDHPGYGATPVPPRDDWKAWDPVAGPREALAYARSERPQLASGTVIVGHSMGVDVVLQWLRERVDVSHVYFFGGAITRPRKTPQDFQDEIDAFHDQRHMRCCLPAQMLQAINDHFYVSAEQYAARLAANHPPIDFVRFGIDYQDVTQDRAPLFNAISQPKVDVYLPGVTHYLNTLSIRQLALIDTRTVVRTAELFSPPAAR